MVLQQSGLLMPLKTQYYRNRVPISFIDADSLWQMNDRGILVLVDLDEHFEIELDIRFYPVTEPVFLYPDEQK